MASEKPMADGLFMKMDKPFATLAFSLAAYVQMFQICVRPVLE